MSDGWDGILDEGEVILWQGGPDGRIVFSSANMVSLVFGLFFSGFAMFWMMMARQAGGFFWMFGLLHFSVGLAIALGPIIGGAYLRRHTWYTLTNRRTFVATNTPIQGKTLKSYPINMDTVLEYDAGSPSTIWFTYAPGRDGKGRRRVGFERIDDGATVYRLMRDVQRNETA